MGGISLNLGKPTLKTGLWSQCPMKPFMHLGSSHFGVYRNPHGDEKSPWSRVLQNFSGVFEILFAYQLQSDQHFMHTLPKFNSSPLKSFRNPKGSRIVFQPSGVCFWLPSLNVSMSSWSTRSYWNQRAVSLASTTETWISSEQWDKPWLFRAKKRGFKDHTSQLCGDYNKPIYWIRIPINNQYNGKLKFFFCRGSN